MKELSYILTITIFILFFSCGEEEANYVIPATPVNFSLDLYNADNHLSSAGNMGIYVTPTTNLSEEYKKQVNASSSVKLSYRAMAGEYLGYSGLLVINTGISTGNNVNLLAYDLCCSNEQQKEIRVVPSNDFKAKCPKCGSIFDLYSGGRAIEGPATTKGKRLQSYRIGSIGEYKIRISN